MYPVLFKAGFIEIQSYYVLWSIALVSAMIWTNKRTDRSDLPVREVSSVISYSFMGLIIGAGVFEYISNWQFYYENPDFLFDINRCKVSEIGGAAGAIIVAYIMCHVKKVSFWKLIDIVTPAALLAIAIGRWGCFLTGCCGGISGHYPQLYYSFAAAVILSIALIIENYNKAKGIIFKYGIVAPVVIVLYSISRLYIDQFRAESHTAGIILSNRVLVVTLVIALIWFVTSLNNREQLKGDIELDLEDIEQDTEDVEQDTEDVKQDTEDVKQDTEGS